MGLVGDAAFELGGESLLVGFDGLLEVLDDEFEVGEAAGEGLGDMAC